MTGKDKIIASGITLFASEGYERTSIQRLAEVSGVSQGLLYRHFRSKNDLLLHLLQIGMSQIAGTLLPYSDQSLTPPQAYEQHIDLCMALLPANRQLWKTLHSVRHQPALLSELGIIIDFEQEVIQPISTAIVRGGYADSHTLAWTIVSLVDGMTGMYLLYPNVYPLDKIANLLKSKADVLFDS